MLSGEVNRRQHLLTRLDQNLRIVALCKTPHLEPCDTGEVCTYHLPYELWWLALRNISGETDWTVTLSTRHPESLNNVKGEKGSMIKISFSPMTENFPEGTASLSPHFWLLYTMRWGVTTKLWPRLFFSQLCRKGNHNNQSLDMGVDVARRSTLCPFLQRCSLAQIVRAHNTSIPHRNKKLQQLLLTQCRRFMTHLEICSWTPPMGQKHWLKCCHAAKQVWTWSAI